MAACGRFAFRPLPTFPGRGAAHRDSGPSSRSTSRNILARNCTGPTTGDPEGIAGIHLHVVGGSQTEVDRCPVRGRPFLQICVTNLTNAPLVYGAMLGGSLAFAI